MQWTWGGFIIYWGIPEHHLFWRRASAGILTFWDDLLNAHLPVILSNIASQPFKVDFLFSLITLLSSDHIWQPQLGKITCTPHLYLIGLHDIGGKMAARYFTTINVIWKGKEVSPDDLLYLEITMNCYRIIEILLVSAFAFILSVIFF